MKKPRQKKGHFPNRGVPFVLIQKERKRQGGEWGTRSSPSFKDGKPSVFLSSALGPTSSLFFIPNSPTALYKFLWEPSARSRSVKKPLLFEIRVFQRIEFNGFSGGGGNAKKISQAVIFPVPFLIIQKRNRKIETQAYQSIYSQQIGVALSNFNRLLVMLMYTFHKVNYLRQRPDKFFGVTMCSSLNLL
ncbi:hypothetical protein ACG2F4_06195 [Halalkalibaculum sp. DA3122]|uniref:hypothetical protein n=1 Tax=unclassified Halalkalibaculum TaxID=2964617 RepID=UPI003754A46E